MQPKRIFILGLQRSGTTWLANMLASLPQVAAVQHETHQGVHESVFFSHFAKNFGSWEDINARVSFMRAFASSDYFKLTGLEEELLVEFLSTKASFGDVFTSLMDVYALVEGADAWIEKSPHHTMYVNDILRSAPDAKFIMVERDLVDLVQSRLNGFGRRPRGGVRGLVDVLRGTVTAVMYRREMRALERAQKGMIVRYEHLKDDPEGRTRQRVLDFLDLDASYDEMESAYAPNSSYTSDKPKRYGLATRAFIRAVAGASQCVPQAMLRRIHEKRDAARGPDWPDWVWKTSGFDPAQFKRDAAVQDRYLILD